MRCILAIGVCLAAAHAACAQFVSGPAAPASFAPYAAPAARLAPPPAAPSQPHIHPAVCRIVAPGNGSVSYGSGTLVYANESAGVVVTNWHVINEATGPISVHFPDGFYSLGSVQDVDRDWDLALIVIRKPNAEPVPLATQAPRPGEILTIAGYGSGQYRAASGVCTQYVAPGLEFPYEMVEVAVSARQGDSGGPMFNSRGELAGVLFGEGDGRTSGSYCGRVRWFLSRLVPSAPQQAVMVVQAPLEPVPARPVAHEQPAPAANVPAEIASARSTGFASSSSPWQPGEPARSESTPPVVVSTRAEPPGPATVQIGWHDIAGETWAQQAKTVLAAVGALAILLHVLGWISREKAAA